MALGMWDMHRFPTALYTTSISKTLRNSSQVMGVATPSSGPDLTSKDNAAQLPGAKEKHKTILSESLKTT